MKNLCEVYCVGNAVADVLARPVDQLAASGTSQPLDDLALGPGGNAVNTAIALARMGILSEYRPQLAPTSLANSYSTASSPKASTPQVW